MDIERATHPARVLRRVLIVLAIAGFAVTTWLAPAPGAAQQAPAQQLSEWSGCGNGWECATLTVPLDYDDPNGPTMDIAISRRPAGNSGERIGILLTNPGGPGGEGIGYARSWARTLDSDITDRFDIIGFDPRGVGASEPLQCGQNVVDLLGVDQSPNTEADFDEFFAVAEEFAGDCQEKKGDILPHLGTRNVARDMDEIRKALGEEQITYVGYSYGTRIGSVYADLFPDRVRAMVLDGAQDNSLPIAEDNLQQAAGFDLALNNFLEDCRQTNCRLARNGDPMDLVLDVIEAVETQRVLPAPSASRDARPGEVMLGMILPLYDQRLWPLLEIALADAAEGDASGLVNNADIYVGLADTAILYAVNCIDAERTDDAVDTWEEYQEALPLAREVAPIFGPGVLVNTCGLWNFGADPIGVPTAAGAPPIVVIGTTGDPATPYEGAVAAAEDLESGILLTHEGEGHTVYGGGDSLCIDRLVDDYLVNLVSPVDGTSCTGDEDPVLPSLQDATPAPNGTAAPAPPTEGDPTSTVTIQPPATGDGDESGGLDWGLVALAALAVVVLGIGGTAFYLGRRTS